MIKLNQMFHNRSRFILRRLLSLLLVGSWFLAGAQPGTAAEQKTIDVTMPAGKDKVAVDFYIPIGKAATGFRENWVDWGTYQPPNGPPQKMNYVRYLIEKVDILANLLDYWWSSGRPSTDASSWVIDPSQKGLTPGPPGADHTHFKLWVYGGTGTHLILTYQLVDSRYENPPVLVSPGSTPVSQSGTGQVGDGIRILSATYGGNCGVAEGNVTDHIARQCNGKYRCHYTVDHKVIGDPAYGCEKTYVVRYQCGNNPQVFEKFLAGEAGWGDKSVFLECWGDPNLSPSPATIRTPGSGITAQPVATLTPTSGITVPPVPTPTPDGGTIVQPAATLTPATGITVLPVITPTPDTIIQPAVTLTPAIGIKVKPSATPSPPRRYVAAIRYRPKEDFYTPCTRIQFSYKYNTPLRPGDRIIKEDWYINGKLKRTRRPGLTGKERGFPVRFEYFDPPNCPPPGIYVVELRIYSTPTLFTRAKQIIKIGQPKPITPTPHSATPTPIVIIVADPAPTPNYRMPITITFTSQPLIPSGHWYVNGVFIRTGDNLTYTFKKTVRYEVELRRMARGPVLARKIITGTQGPTLWGTWVNKFQTRNSPADLSNLEICMIYWIGGSGKWSGCMTFSGGRIGAVDGYDLCTGEQEDLYNTGWLVYSPKGSGELKYKVFASKDKATKGYVKYSGKLELHRRIPIPSSINFIDCKIRAATVQWKNEDESICRARIWKTLPSSKYSKNIVVKGGVEDLGCTDLEKKDTLLWGKQTKGWGATNAKTDGNEVTLKMIYSIVRVEGNAKDYCIWSGGRSVLCGGNGRPSIEGRTLPAGKYTVLPGILDNEKVAKVRIYLRRAPGQ